MACIVVKSFVWLYGRIHGVFCTEECCEAGRRNAWHILW